MKAIISYLEYILMSNLIPMIALVTLLVFVCINPIFARKQSKLFIIAIVTNILALVAISLDFVFTKRGVSSYFFIFRRITSFLNFALSPLIPYLLYQIFSPKKFSPLLSVPLILNFAICFASIFCRIVFFIDSSNGYNRGVLFLLPIITTEFYVFLMMFNRAGAHMKSKRNEKIFLFATVLLLTGSIVLEILFNFRFLTWDVSALILVLYYLLLNLHGRVIDSLTGIYNRFMFDKAIENIDKRKKCILAILDINDFKTINDTQGHDAGDKYLAKFATLLNKSMLGTATVYRIGGDEFFCISKRGDIEKFQNALVVFGQYCEKYNLSYACGIATYHPDSDIAATMKEADTLMYQNKQAFKALNAEKIV